MIRRGSASLRERRYACAAYTTLGRHLLAGEERLSVVDQGDSIVVDILSVSRGRGFGSASSSRFARAHRCSGGSSPPPRAARRRRGAACLS